MVNVAIKALERAGTSVGRETLAAILPELSESVNTAELHRGSGSSFDSVIRSDLLGHCEYQASEDLLAQVRAAISAIDSRSRLSP